MTFCLFAFLQIDFGEVDFGDNAIDFGNDIDFSAVNTDNITLEQGDIHWGEGGMDDLKAEISLADSGITSESANGVAKGSEAYTILDSPSHREQFIDELYEVRSNSIF